jgi:hypothetical protein
LSAAHEDAYGKDTTHEAGDDKSGYWTKIGAAWPHKDGKGYSISITTVPLEGRLVVRERPEEETPAEEKETVATD